jgi:hypothetical protein
MNLTRNARLLPCKESSKIGILTECFGAGFLVTVLKIVARPISGLSNFTNTAVRFPVFVFSNPVTVPKAPFTRPSSVSKFLIKITLQDIDVLSSVSFNQTPESCRKVLHIFPTNKEVRKHNEEMLKAVCDTLVMSKAQDYFKNSTSGKLTL